MAAPSATTKKPSDPYAKYETDWDPANLDEVLAPVEAPLASYSTSSPIDVLRRAIAADASRHDTWLHLRQYRPMPKRTAMAMAASWRRVSPTRYSGDRNFQARILPTDDTGRARSDIAVTKSTLYAVAVLYPSATPEQVHTPDER